MSESPALPPLDPAVLRAMARWPDVPQCYGWLGLDRRGTWLIRGDAIAHAGTIAFLGRHYRADAQGRWYVQNGPQQAFVDLEYTPWILRFDTHDGFTTHTGLDVGRPRAAFQDDEGNLLLDTALGFGLVDDRDLSACAEHLAWTEAGPSTLHWRGCTLPVCAIERAAVPARGGFEPRPRAAAD